MIEASPGIYKNQKFNWTEEGQLFTMIKTGNSSISAEVSNKQKTPNITIRQALLTDYKQIVSNFSSVYDGMDYLPAKFCYYLMQPKRFRCFVAEAYEYIVGYMMSQIVDGGQAQTRMAVRVHPDYQGQGISRKLDAYRMESLEKDYPGISRTVRFTSPNPDLYMEKIRSGGRPGLRIVGKQAHTYLSLPIEDLPGFMAAVEQDTSWERQHFTICRDVQLGAQIIGSLKESTLPAKDIVLFDWEPFSINSKDDLIYTLSHQSVTLSWPISQSDDSTISQSYGQKVSQSDDSKISQVDDSKILTNESGGLIQADVRGIGICTSYNCPAGVTLTMDFYNCSVKDIIAHIIFILKQRSVEIMGRKNMKIVLSIFNQNMNSLVDVRDYFSSTFGWSDKAELGTSEIAVLVEDEL